MYPIEEPRVSIVIPNYNGREHLEKCIPAILEQSHRSFQIIVVDNHSSDGSSEFLSAHFPQVKVLPQSVNLGFAGGCNRGVATAIDDLVVLLNNDTVVEPNWLAELVRASEPEEVAVVGSRCLTQGVPPAYYKMNGTLNLLGYNIMRIFSDLRQVFYVSGCAVLIKKKLLPVPFDDDYFLFAEDVYMGWRARLLGYRVLQSPTSVVHHVGSATTSKQRRGFVLYHQQRNRVLNLFLFYEGKTLLKLLPLLVLDMLGKVIEGLTVKPGTFQALLKGYLWLLFNSRRVLEKRRRIQSERRIPDREILKWMSCKLVNTEGRGGRFLNGLSRRYCRLLKLHTVEFNS